ncbi:uncharacterized protein [Trachinotus anak]|uniref:uncharacterized protein n=1 Tax=Trachinotus anak TaxID=443729 RepID=UPI0039F1CAD5
MDTDFIFEQVQHMRPSSFSEREKQHYQAEKMLMRQFVLMKQKYQVPTYLSTGDMKAWLLAGRSFLEEFQETAKRAEPRQLLMAELAWTSARRRCLDHMEEELQEELETERRLSLLLSRKVTVEGLQMFLSVIRPKARHDVWIFLHHLFNKLLSSATGSHTSKRSELALITRLQWATSPKVTQIVDTALAFLLDDPEPPDEVKPSQTQGLVESRDFSSASALGDRTEAASAEVGRLLADTAATCFCLNTSFTKARLLRLCTSVARDMVKAIYKRFVDRSKTFHLLNFDESFIAARRGVICAIQDMDDRAQRAAYRWALHQFCTDKDPLIPEMCCVVDTERADEEEDKDSWRGVRAFFSRIWKKMFHGSTEE